MKKLSFLGLVFSALFLFSTAPVWAQLSVPPTGATIDFETTLSGVNNGAFTGSGFQSSPSSGRLDSDAWSTSGFGDNAAFGSTSTSGDAARGYSSGGESSGGVYSFNTGGGNHSLGVQPAGSDFTPGTFTLRWTNNTGATLTSFDVSYVIYVRNDQARGNSFNFSHGSTSSASTSVSSLNYTSPSSSSGSAWITVNRSTTITGVSIPDGGTYYFQWSGNDVSGSGSRDEFALDDITITPPVPTSTCMIGITSAGTQTPCDPITNEYTQELTITYSDEPSSGMLDVNGQTFAITGSPQTVVLTGLDSDGADVDVTAYFTDDVGCNTTEVAVFTAPDYCIPPPELVINEIEYDNDGSDDTEFIEIYNYGSSAIDLDPYDLVLVNGSGASIYQTIDLPSYMLAAGDYFVVCENASTTPNCDLEVISSIQNGSPDAVALRDAGVVFEAVSYEGVTGGGYTEGGSGSTGDNSSANAQGIGRYPDGNDTDNNGADFMNMCNTPGEANTNNMTDCGPANDDCINAIALDFSGYDRRTRFNNCESDMGTNFGATVEVGESTASCATFGNDHSVWYTFTTPDCVPGEIYLSTNLPGTEYDTRFAVYYSADGSCNFAGFTEIACNDDYSIAGECSTTPGSGFESTEEFGVSLLPNSTYYIQVEGYDNSRGNFEVSLVQYLDEFGLIPGTNPESQINYTWNAFSGDNLDIFYSPSTSSGYAVRWNRSASGGVELANYLMPGTQYEFWGNYSCGLGMDQFWGPMDTLSTEASPCTAPDPLLCGASTSNSITFSWTPTADPGARYHVYYRQVGSSGYNVRWNRPGSSYTIAGLMPSTAYEIWVITDCAPGVRFTSATLTCTTAGPSATARMSGEDTGANFTYDGWEYVDYPWNMINIPMPETVSEVVAVDGELMAFDMAGDKVDFSNASEPTVSAFDFELIPNVTTNETSVRFYQATATNANVGVYDLQGKMVYSEDLGEVNGFVNHTISTSDMAAGLYHVVVNTADEVMSKKLVIVQ